MTKSIEKEEDDWDVFKIGVKMYVKGYLYVKAESLEKALYEGSCLGPTEYESYKSYIDEVYVYDDE